MGSPDSSEIDNYHMLGGWIGDDHPKVFAFPAMVPKERVSRLQSVIPYQRTQRLPRNDVLFDCGSLFTVANS